MILKCDTVIDECVYRYIMLANSLEMYTFRTNRDSVIQTRVTKDSLKIISKK